MGTSTDTGRTTPPIAALGDELLRIQRRRAQVYEGSQLENSAFRLLWMLSDRTPRTLRTLACELGLDQSTVNRQVHAAMDAGYLERFVPEDGDARAGRLVRPTASGLAAYEHDGRVRATLIGSVLDELDRSHPGRAEALVADLRALNDAWDAALAGFAAPE